MTKTEEWWRTCLCLAVCQDSFLPAELCPWRLLWCGSRYFCEATSPGKSNIQEISKVWTDKYPTLPTNALTKEKEWFIAACSFAVNAVRDPRPNPWVANRNMLPMLRCDPELPTFQRTIPLPGRLSYNVNFEWCHCSGLDKYFWRKLIL